MARPYPLPLHTLHNPYNLGHPSSSESLSKSSSPTLIAHLTALGWLVNTDKTQGPGIARKYKHTPTHHPQTITGTGFRDTNSGAGSFCGEPTVVTQPWNGFPPLRQGTKYKTFNRHNTGEVMTIKQNISNNSILR